MFPSGGEWIKHRSTPLKRDPSIPSSHGRPEPIRDSDCEVMLPLTFDEVASLLLTWPRVGERPRFMSWHDSNTIIRHRARLSEGERAERRVMCAGGRWRLRRLSMTDRHSTCRQAGEQRGVCTHNIWIITKILKPCKQTHTYEHTVEVGQIWNGKDALYSNAGMSVTFM